MKIAMFNEVNEGTAIFKAVSQRSEAPSAGFWLVFILPMNKAGTRFNAVVWKAHSLRRALFSSRPAISIGQY